MANTLIQIKRSNTTYQPTGGSLSAGELAYSYNSNVLFIGTSTGTDVVPIGGEFFTNRINTTVIVANAAFAAANIANTRAISAFNFANTVNIATAAAFNFANTVNIATAASFAAANTANYYAYLVDANSTAAFAKANAALANATGTFNGTLTVANNLVVTGNTITGALKHSPVVLSKLLNSFDAADTDRASRTALNGDASVLAVGASGWEGATGADRGGVYIYDWNGSAWVQRGSVLEAADAADSDVFGVSVSLNSTGTILAVGASGWEGATGTNRGGVYIYDWSGSAWVQRGSVLEAADAADSDGFGLSLSLNSTGTILAVGAVNWEGATGTNRGGVYIYDWNGSAWVQRGSVIEAADAADSDFFGASVSLSSDGSILAVTANGWEGATGADRGGVYIYDWSGSAWVQRGSVLEAADAADIDIFGISISLSSDGSILTAGAREWEGAIGSSRGAVYTYTLTGAMPGGTSVSTGSGWIEGSNSTLVARTAGLDRITINANGNVGIGTTSPTSTLHVVGSANITSNLVVQGVDVLQTISAANTYANSTYVKLTAPSQTITGNVIVSGNFSTTGNVTLGDASTDAITINGSIISLGNNQSIDSSTLFIDATNNRVGVGITSPTSNLHVNGSAYFGNGSESQQFDFVTRGDIDGIRLYSLNNPSGGSVNPPSIGFYRSLTTGPSTNPRFRIMGRAPNSADISGFLLTSPDVSVNWIGADVDRGSRSGLSLVANTTNVTYFYQQSYFTNGTLVVGTDSISLTAPVGGTIRSGQKNQNVNDTVGSSLTLQAGGGTGSGAPGDLIIQTADIQASGNTIQPYTTKVTVKASGNVGIGTSSPTSNLHVIGTANITGALAASGFFSSTTLGFRANNDARYGTTSGWTTFITGNGVDVVATQGGFFGFKSDVVLGWTSTTTPGNPDTRLVRDAANTIAQRYDTFGQTYRLYGTYTDGSNYERLNITANTTAHYIIGEEGGTGNARPMYLGTNNSTTMTLDTAGRVGIGTTTNIDKRLTLYDNTTTGSGIKVGAGPTNHYVILGQTVGAAGYGGQYIPFGYFYDNNSTFLFNYDPSTSPNHGNYFEYGNRTSNNIDNSSYPASLEFFPRGQRTTRPALFLANNAFVGIGTRTPTSKLHVIGTANITSNLIVQGADVMQTMAGANTAVGAGANAYADTAAAGANAYMISVQDGSNTAVGTGANTYANATFVRLTASSQTITGDLAIVGNLSLSGNTVFSNATTLVISDPLIYLAGNNYSSDIVDIGFIGNYVNSTGSNVHTGLFREHGNKEYYLFQGYDQEPTNNHIDPTANGFALATLNADLKTSNLTLGGTNTITWITSSFGAANTSGTIGSSAFGQANLAFTQANTATTIGSSAFGQANLAFTQANNVGGAVTTSNNIAIAAFAKANAALANSTGTFNGTLTVANDLVVTGNVTVDSNTFHIDATNNRVGIGTASSGYKLEVNGSFAATTKSFVIKHPTKKGMKLRYGSLESPYHGVRLTGESTIKDKVCRVELPDYIRGLCKQEGAQVQITNIKHGKVLWVETLDVDNNYFEISFDRKSTDKKSYSFYWSFTAIRKDIEDMIVEFEG